MIKSSIDMPCTPVMVKRKTVCRMACHFSIISCASFRSGKSHIAFDFEYHMVRYLDPIQNPGDVKINFREHKGYTWVTPEDGIKMGLITDEDTCSEIVFGLNRAR
ncbi:MAG: hypothetical protein IT584_02945 [Chlamydiae bacterium]|nr:hypothetical protein [Chlamydiota bacterium]